MNDIIVLDNIIPKATQDRFAYYISGGEFAWKDYNHITTSGAYFKDLTFNSDAVMVPSDSLISLVYYNNFKESKVFDQSVFWLGVAVLDEYERRTGNKVSAIMRMKVNNQGQSTVDGYDDNCCNEIHVDNFEEHKTIVYYVNDCDGDTFLFDRLWEEGEKHYDVKTLQRVTPQQGRAVCFNGLRFHAPSNPIYGRRRYILNINFI
jgi:hypothetical protein